jgi:hypothetical protein
MIERKLEIKHLMPSKSVKFYSSYILYSQKTMTTDMAFVVPYRTKTMDMDSAFLYTIDCIVILKYTLI